MATATIQTDSNNDLYLTDGRNLSVITGVDACTQDIRHATLMRLGEDVLDTANGVDYFGTVFTPQPDQDAATQSLSDNILSCPDVLSIESLNVAISDNVFNYVALINTAYGQLTVSNQ